MADDAVGICIVCINMVVAASICYPAAGSVAGFAADILRHAGVAVGAGLTGCSDLMVLLPGRACSPGTRGMTAAAIRFGDNAGMAGRAVYPLIDSGMVVCLGIHAPGGGVMAAFAAGDDRQLGVTLLACFAAGGSQFVVSLSRRALVAVGADAAFTRKAAGVAVRAAFADGRHFVMLRLG
jgi:hypothetical protein